MLHKLAYKVPGGKLLKVEAEIDGALIRRLSLRGDFFAHPEEGFDRVEAAMQNVYVDEIEEKLEEALSRESVTLYGISPHDVAETVRRMARETETP